ncbi:tyrosine-protein kinase family protein [Halanaerobium congolense]|uniref:tyrosine-protein kinase family protein n=1 Tax=Halanaerobium congolense TaxID=54121 RepID=UPI00117B1940|nr:AAA family ATPase [Halanaerobium congolense]
MQKPGILTCKKHAEFSGIQKPSPKTDKSAGWESMLKGLENDKKIFDLDDKSELPRLISFYSYKGGVGRTLALVQTAYLLAKKGKNVLMLDLDIEAPSLHDIFSDKINLDKGIVDYLYEQEFSGDKTEIELDNIVSSIKVDETLEGNLYTIPAGVLSAEYIYKLTQLKPKFLSQKEYLSVLLKKVKEKLDIDLVLIDSRTGINDWGAFSILDMADEVFFFAYPNEENFNGTKVIVDLLKNLQLKKFTIIFSRVESDGGLDYAQQLFDDLELEQEFLSIIYNPRLALIKEFPNEKYLDEYQEIADFILERDQIEINEFYISNYVNKNEILEKLLNKINNDFYITEAEKKLMQDRYNYIIADSKVIENRFSKLTENFRRISPLEMENGSNLVGFVKNKLAFIEDENFLSSNHFEDLTDILSYFYYIILVTVNNSGFKTNFSTRQFDEEEYYNKKEEFLELNFEQRIQKFKDLVFVEKESDSILYLKENREGINEVERDINLVINLDVFANNLTEAQIKLLNSAVEFIKEHLPKIKVKIVLARDFYDDNSELFTDLLELYQLEWKKDDLKKLIIDYLFSISDQIKDYLNVINDANDRASFIEKLAEYKRKEEDKIDDLEHDGRFVNNGVKIKTNNLLNLFWGIRIKPEIYLKKVIDYFYDQLEVKGLMNPIAIADILKKAINFEIENNLANKESFISKDSLMEVIEKN